jgi:beta-glucosidase
VYNITQFRFEKGKVYDLKVEFFENWGSCRCILGLEKFKPAPVTEEAVKLASEADIVVMGLGSAKLQEGEGTDKSSLSIDRAQIDLIKRVAKVNKNIVVVLYGGNPVVMNEWKDEVPVIIEAFYPGQEGGNAIANIVTGKVNPSGKLPVTFPEKWEDSPAYGSYPGERQHAEYTEGIFVGYRGYDKNSVEPQFPFGYGLSYTTFEYSDINLSAEKMSPDSELTVSVVVTNTGDVDGDEIVQLYVSDLKASVEREVKALKGFERVKLKAGESKTVTFTIDKVDLSFYDVDSKSWIAEKGKFEVLIGASSRDIRLRKTFTLT